jgi:hypothetical protein
MNREGIVVVYSFSLCCRRLFRLGTIVIVAQRLPFAPCVRLPIRAVNVEEHSGHSSPSKTGMACKHYRFPSLLPPRLLPGIGFLLGRRKAFSNFEGVVRTFMGLKLHVLGVLHKAHTPGAELNLVATIGLSDRVRTSDTSWQQFGFPQRHLMQIGVQDRLAYECVLLCVFILHE